MGKARPKSYGTRKGTGSPLCRHCGREKVTRPRGLGWKCYRDAAVRALYPPTPPEEAGRMGARAPRKATKRPRRSQAERFPPAYRAQHEQRILAEQRRVQEELARLGEGQ